MLKELRGSDVIIECLLEQGVDTVFGYPGGAVLNIYDSLYKYSDKIHHVITAHEQAACHAADGYSRTTGRTGVVIATSGPGATNLVTGIATAYMDSIPMVAITGNVTRDLLGLDSFQEVDICGITMPITKHNYIVKDPAELADIIREAFYIANEGRKGPVLIDIPKDITGALMVYEKKEPKKVVNHNPEGINEEIAAAAELIKNAEKPFIYAGGGVVSADATEEMAEFVRKVDAPVSLSLIGQRAKGLAIADAFQCKTMLFQRRTDGSQIVGVLAEFLVEMLAGLVIINIHRDLHPAVGGVIVVAPHAGGVLFLKGKCVIAQNLLMLIGGVHIKQEHAAFFHKKTRIGNGGIQIRDVVEGIKGRYRRPDGTIEIQLEHVAGKHSGNGSGA